MFLAFPELAMLDLAGPWRSSQPRTGCRVLLSRHVPSFPTIKVQPDSIFVKDGNIYTSAGVTAGIDLALALVEEDLRREVALECSKPCRLYAPTWRIVAVQLGIESATYRTKRYWRLDLMGCRSSIFRSYRGRDGGTRSGAPAQLFQGLPARSRSDACFVRRETAG